MGVQLLSGGCRGRAALPDAPGASHTPSGAPSRWTASQMCGKSEQLALLMLFGPVSHSQSAVPKTILVQLQAGNVGTAGFLNMMLALQQLALV